MEAQKRVQQKYWERLGNIMKVDGGIKEVFEYWVVFLALLSLVNDRSRVVG